MVVRLVAHGDTFVSRLLTQLSVDEHRTGTGPGRSVVTEYISDMVEQTGDREQNRRRLIRMVEEVPGVDVSLVGALIQPVDSLFFVLWVIKVNVKDTNDAITAYNNDTNNAEVYRLWNGNDLDTVDLKGKHNTWYFYTLDESQSEYTLAGYGDEKSVFITVETGTLNSTGGDDVTRAITGVTGCFTNVQDVDITSEIPKGVDINDPSVFVVTDKKDYIVGAVIIGENAGSNANYAYILGNAKSEEKIGDTYYWEFEAAVDGEVKNLTLKTKYPSVINGANGIKSRLNNTAGNNALDKKYAHGYLLRLSYDADGYVTNAIPFDQISAGSIIDGTGSNASSWPIWNTSSNNRVVRYMNYGVGSNSTTGDILELRGGNTLYNKSFTGVGGDRGLVLHPDCKFVVIQTEYTKVVKTPYSDINSALGNLATYHIPDPDTGDKYFKGTISAVLDTSGRATFVVFDSLGNIDPDQNETGPAASSKPNVMPLPYNATIDEVNRALTAGQDVVIAGDWRPRDLSTTNYRVYLQDGTHLWIEGDLNADSNGGNGTSGIGLQISGPSTSALTVEGRLTIRGGYFNGFNGKSTVGGLTVETRYGENTSTLNSEMSITGISGDELIVRTGATLNIEANITRRICLM